MNFLLKYSLIALFGILAHGVNGQQTNESINWQQFLSRSDMIYDTLTTKWEEGVFTGNGLLGSMVYMQNAGTMRIEIGRTDVTDHRTDEPNALYAKCRLPIGHFELIPVGRIVKNTARLNLWDAEATGKIETDKGVVTWRTLTLSQTNVIIFEISTSGDEKNFQWIWEPEVSISSRVKYSNDIPKSYRPNPAPEAGRSGNIEYFSQGMIAGGDYTTAWTSLQKGNRKTYFISVDVNKSNSAVSSAVATINDVVNTDISKLIQEHRLWWHHYYPQSFVSIPDARMESFYWIQQYKLASATREGKPPIDLMGPWYRYTPWPAYWYNLNIELTYSPLFTANRLSLAKGYIKMFEDNAGNLARNVPSAYQNNGAALGRSGAADLVRPVKIEPVLDTTATPSDLEMGNLTWCLYYYWLYYRYSMDESLKEKLFPILKRSINYYLDVMNKGDDGKWHLPYTYSPEYPNGITRDCNYDLSLLRWGCMTLLKIHPDDGLAIRWKDVLNNLVDYPADSSGLRIGRDVAFNTSHRHYSHLLMIYPLAIMNWRQAENRHLIKKSIEHWLSFRGALQGYTFTGASSMYAQMGDGNQAVDYLDHLLDKFVKPNTMYLETGPVIETPLSAVTSIQELLLQSWVEEIHVFPAVPDKWQNVSFKDFRTEGAFLISAVRKDGETKWVKVKSLAGGTCVINPGIGGKVKVAGRRRLSTSRKGKLFNLTLERGEEIIFYKDRNDLNIKVSIVDSTEGKTNYWGTKVK